MKKHQFSPYILRMHLLAKDYEKPIKTNQDLLDRDLPVFHVQHSTLIKLVFAYVYYSVVMLCFDVVTNYFIFLGPSFSTWVSQPSKFLTDPIPFAATLPEQKDQSELAPLPLEVYL